VQPRQALLDVIAVTWLSTSEQLDHLRLAAEIADIEVDSIRRPPLEPCLHPEASGEAGQK
jgi:hypothetical protein